MPAGLLQCIFGNNASLSFVRIPPFPQEGAEKVGTENYDNKTKMLGGGLSLRDGDGAERDLERTGAA